MLKYLNIKNIILIDSLEITLENGFNVITGETGAGKSAIISALKLLIGHRSDSKIIRKGSTKASVEASFEVKPHSHIYSILQESGIEIYPNEDLLIKREILPNGKGKVYINHQMAQIALLKKIGDYLIQIVGQHANQRLFREEEHRNIIDLYGDLTPLVQSYQTVWRELHHIENQLKALIEGEAFRIRETERCQDEIEEIEQASIKEGEEEELFAEYTLLIHKEELLKKAAAIYASLQGGEGSILQQLNKKKYLFESLVSIDPSINESFISYRNACLEIEEVSHVLNNYLHNIDSNPEHANIVNERLSLINKIKRKYGPTLHEITEYLTASKDKLKKLENCDLQIEELKEKRKDLLDKTNSLAEELSNLRSEVSKKFEIELVGELRNLNMPKVQFQVKLSKQSRCLSGDDKIEFFFAPNTGEHVIPIKDSASGGEISRIVLAIEKILSSKNDVPTIVFDEVDANIGGETAVVVGQMLKKIGEYLQVICITHFPQVAKQAEQHLQITKMEIEGRTISVIKNLNQHTKEDELRRMAGMGAHVAESLVVDDF